MFMEASVEQSTLSTLGQHNSGNVATLSQVLNLKNNELNQVADFLGHDIRVHRDFYRLPVPTTQLARISKLLFLMEKGNLSSMQGKSLDEIEIEGLYRN